MRMHNAQSQRYLREVRSWLPCSRKLKREILEEINNTITQYLSENPGAAYTDFTARFGTPQQIAASYVSEMEIGELLRDLRIKRRIIGIVAATVAVLIFLWAGLVVASYVDHTKDVNGYLVIGEVTVIERTETNQVEE